MGDFQMVLTLLGLVSVGVVADGAVEIDVLVPGVDIGHPWMTIYIEPVDDIFSAALPFDFAEFS